jgi:hypothetical protein
LQNARPAVGVAMDDPDTFCAFVHGRALVHQIRCSNFVVCMRLVRLWACLVACRLIPTAASMRVRAMPASSSDRMRARIAVQRVHSYTSSLLIPYFSMWVPHACPAPRSGGNSLGPWLAGLFIATVVAWLAACMVFHCMQRFLLCFEPRFSDAVISDVLAYD